MLELLYSFLSNQDSLFILIFFYKLIFYPEIYKLFYVRKGKNKPAQQKFEVNKSQQPSNSAFHPIFLQSNEKQSWTNVTKWAMLAEKNSSNYTACIWKSGGQK